MGLVDFMNFDVMVWYQFYLCWFIVQGVDCFKIDFGECIFIDVVWVDGVDLECMYNFYVDLYNCVVYEVLIEMCGEGDVVVFV